MRPGWQPSPPPPRSLVVSEKLRRVATTAQLAKNAGMQTLSSSEVGDALVMIGWKQPESANNHIGDCLGKSGLKLKRVKSPKGGSTYELPQCDIVTHMRELGYDIDGFDVES
jgi:hypothetical protein